MFINFLSKKMVHRSFPLFSLKKPQRKDARVKNSSGGVQSVFFLLVLERKQGVFQAITKRFFKTWRHSRKQTGQETKAKENHIEN